MKNNHVCRRGSGSDHDPVRPSGPQLVRSDRRISFDGRNGFESRCE